MKGNSITAFAHVDYPTEHPGVARAQNAAAAFQRVAGGFDGARGAASLLMAGAVAALLVVANQAVDTLANGQVVAAWMMLWVVAFAGIALFRAPARRASVALRAVGTRWAENRRVAVEDEKTWQMAVKDLRVMADISHALDRRAVDDIRKYR